MADETTEDFDWVKLCALSERVHRVDAGALPDDQVKPLIRALAGLLERSPSDAEEAVVYHDARSLVARHTGDFVAAIRHARAEIELITKLHSITKAGSGTMRALKGRDQDCLDDRTRTLLALERYHEQGLAPDALRLELRRPSLETAFSWVDLSETCEEAHDAVERQDSTTARSLTKRLAALLRSPPTGAEEAIVFHDAMALVSGRDGRPGDAIDHLGIVVNRIVGLHAWRRAEGREHEYTPWDVECLSKRRARLAVIKDRESN